MLRYVELWELNREDRAEPQGPIESHRMVRVSDGWVRFMDVVGKSDGGPGDTEVQWSSRRWSWVVRSFGRARARPP